MTLGYLWGWQAYLLGRDKIWLRSTHPDCAGAAIYALQGVSRAGPPIPLRRWLIASLLKATKIWCQCALNKAGGDFVPAVATDLPDLLVAV